jgi:hypothetical protein
LRTFLVERVLFPGLPGVVSVIFIVLAIFELLLDLFVLGDNCTNSNLGSSFTGDGGGASGVFLT